MTTMSTLRRIITGIVLALALPAAQAESVPLFDGKTFTGWEGDITQTWRIEEGAFTAGNLETKQPKNDFLATTKAYGNFELTLEVKIAGT
ncbi:MAG: family 16 glycoside hydrolase, partial [Verrucomicrobiales bacterium]